MEERRQMRRFTLRLPCLIYDWNGNNGDLLLQARTRNVGIGGAHVDRSLPLPTGIRLGFSLLIQPTGSSKDARQYSCISLTAQVLRIGNDGMGVAFSEAYRIIPAVHLASQCRAVSQWLDQWASVPEEPATVDNGFGLAQDPNGISLLAALSSPSSGGR